ncbi:hypothetical protein [Bartonella grahamii]|uniref:hypothetical protein n=1 Tax=Bartonella grahamii TaxID=33045 RepID=UPI002E7B432D|nr:hypothetical protein [Bartonella grahamii]
MAVVGGGLYGCCRGVVRLVVGSGGMAFVGGVGMGFVGGAGYMACRRERDYGCRRRG